MGILDRAALQTGSDAEVSTWFAARYMIMTARGLREVQPEVGDIVTSHGWAGDRRVIWLFLLEVGAGESASDQQHP